MITTGRIGDIITITGNNLYDISSVIFSNNASGTFSEFNGSLLVTVPKESAWGPVLICSQSRGISGYSSFWFAPEPIITGYYPSSGIPGQSIAINGYSLSGITGVTFNNLYSSSITVNSPSGLTATVPTGNTNGYIKVIGASGLYFSSDVIFKPMAVITGISSNIARTGDLIRISGMNFLPEIMLSDSSLSNNYFVSFNGSTGSFGLVNSTLLTGLVPSLATSGYVNILKTISESYPSNYILNIIPSNPIISSISLSSGNIGNPFYIEGSNFNGISKVRFSRSGLFVDVFSGIYTSSLENVISLNIPTGLVEGKHSLVIYASGGQVTGSDIILIRKEPSVSGFSPSYAFAGQVLRLSGANLYSDSHVYFNDINSPPLEYITGDDNNLFIDVKIPGQSSLSNYIIVDNNYSEYYHPTPIQFIEAPKISGFYPVSGSWGDSILVSGTGFSYVNYVSIGNSSGQFSVVNDTGINIIVPTGSYDTYITLFNPLTSGVSNTYLNVIDPSGVISGFSPLTVYASQSIVVSGLYLDRITGVIWSGSSGLFSSSDFGIQSGTNSLVIEVPFGALSQRVLLSNERAISSSQSVLNILQPPVITGLNPSYATYNTTVTISGYNFSGNQFYFKDFRGGYVSGNDTTIISSTLATTKVPRMGRGGIVTSNLMVSGYNGLYDSEIKFYPLPTVNGVNVPTTGTRVGDYIEFELINGSEVTGLLISGSGRISSIIDSSDKMLFNYDMEYPHTVITGYLNGMFYGTGHLYPIWSGWTDFNNNISNRFSGTKYQTSVLNLTGGAFDISGMNGDQISFNQILEISGSNLKRIKDVFISGASIGMESLQSFDWVSDKLITGVIGLIPDGPANDAKIIVRDYQDSYFNLSNTVTYYQDMRFTYSSKPLQGTSIFTGTYVLVSGSHFQGLPAFGYGAAYLKSSSITDNSIPVYIDSYYSNFSFGGSLNNENIAFIIPENNTITDQTFDLHFINSAGGTGILSGIKISNYQSVKNLDELEMKIYLFS